MDRWLAVSTVARRLQVSSRTIRRWIHAGKMSGERSQTGRHRVRASVLVAFQQKADTPALKVGHHP